MPSNIADWVMKRGDLLPEIEGTLVGADGTPVNGSAATVRFHMRRKGTSAITINAPAVWVDQANGIVKYTWAAGDTNLAELFEGEFEVTFGDGRKMTFPNDGFKSIRIGEDLA